MRSPNSQRLITLFAAAIALITNATAGDTVSYRVIAYGLQDAPGLPGRQFAQGNAFSLPVINNNGDVAFRGSLLPVTSEGNDTIWRETAGTLSLVAQSHVTPMTGAAVFAGAFQPPNINDDGDVLFMATLTGDGVTSFNDSSVWRTNAGALDLVAREDDPAPGVAGGVFGAFGDQRFNAGGHAAFIAFIRGVSSTSDMGIWSTGAGTLALVAREGDPIPGVTGTVNFLFLPPSLNGQGSITFNGLVNFPFNQGVWKGVPGSIVPVAKGTDTAPGTGGGTFSGFIADRFEPLINDVGNVAFVANITGVAGGNSGIWSDAPGALELVARQGAAAPGTAAVFSSFAATHSSLMLNGAGRVAFRAGLTGAPLDADSGIWAENESGVQLVMREGEAAPGVGDATFGDMHPQFFRSVAFNNAGHVAFKAPLVGDDITTNNDEGVWMTNADGDLVLVLRKGDSLEIAPGDTRVVGGIDLHFHSGGQDGRGRAFNDSGELVMLVRFSDNVRAVLVASLNGVSQCPGDTNGDGVVDFADFSAVLAAYGACKGEPAYDPDADLNSDDCVDFADFSGVLAQYGVSCD